MFSSENHFMTIVSMYILVGMQYVFVTGSDSYSIVYIVYILGGFFSLAFN